MSAGNESDLLYLSALDTMRGMYYWSTIADNDYELNSDFVFIKQNTHKQILRVHSRIFSVKKKLGC